MSLNLATLSFLICPHAPSSGTCPSSGPDVTMRPSEVSCGPITSPSPSALILQLFTSFAQHSPPPPILDGSWGCGSRWGLLVCPGGRREERTRPSWRSGHEVSMEKAVRRLAPCRSPREGGHWSRRWRHVFPWDYDYAYDYCHSPRVDHRICSAGKK